MRFLSLILAAALGFLAPVSMTLAEGEVQFFGSDDPAMSTAMVEARATLPQFYEAAAAADLSQGEFLVKWAHPVEDNTSFEHIWVISATVESSSLTGFLANQPIGFAGVSGDPVTVPRDQISDWSYWDQAGKLHGSYTTRVMLPQLSQADQDYFATILAPLPK